MKLLFTSNQFLHFQIDLLCGFTLLRSCTCIQSNHSNDIVNEFLSKVKLNIYTNFGKYIHNNTTMKCLTTRLYTIRYYFRYSNCHLFRKEK